MADGPLIDAAKAGDHQAFLSLLAKYDRQLMSVVYRFTGNIYDREDLYQEVFLHVYRDIRKFRGDATFSTWLYRVALNRCIRYMRKSTPVAELREEAAPGINHEQRAQVAAIHKAAAKLKGNQRICFHLHYVEGWELSMIADTIEASTGAVKTHLSRARQKIKDNGEVRLWQIEAS